MGSSAFGRVASSSRLAGIHMRHLRYAPLTSLAARINSQSLSLSSLLVSESATNSTMTEEAKQSETDSLVDIDKILGELSIKVLSASIIRPAMDRKANLQVLADASRGIMNVSKTLGLTTKQIRPAQANY